MPSHPLDGCVAKLQRGEQHANYLTEQRTQFLSAVPYLEVLDSSSEPGYAIQRIELTAPPVIDWAVIIGDALHNQRSALDYLAFELVRLNRAVPDQNTAFPIQDTPHPDSFNRATRGMHVSHAAMVEAEQH